MNGDGGALFLLGPNTIQNNYTIPLGLYLSNVTFLNNTADAGGAVFLSNGNYSINNTQFTNNTASQGGALFFNNCDSDSQFNNVKWTLNVATDSGAALYAVSASSYCNNCIFANNTGRSNGGTKIHSLPYNKYQISYIFKYGSYDCN